MVFLYLFLGIACLWDYGLRRIPNILQMGMFGIGILCSYFCGSWGGVLNYFISFLVTTFFFSIFFRLGMIGGGDVKLLGISSGFFGGRSALYFVFFSLLVSAVFSLIKMLARRQFAERFRFLGNYLKNIYRNLESGEKGKCLELYMTDRNEKVRCGIAMSGPVLISALLHLGGVY